MSLQSKNIPVESLCSVWWVWTRVCSLTASGTLYLHLWRFVCLLITKTPHQHPGVLGLYLAGCPLGTETEVSGSLWGLRTELQWAVPQSCLNTGSCEILPYSMRGASNLYVKTSVRASAPSTAQDWNPGRKEWRQWDRGVKRGTAEGRPILPSEKGEK